MLQRDRQRKMVGNQPAFRIESHRRSTNQLIHCSLIDRKPPEQYSLEFQLLNRRAFVCVCTHIFCLPESDSNFRCAAYRMDPVQARRGASFLTPPFLEV